MPLSDRQKIDYAKSYLRRQYTIDDLAELKALADTTFSAATDTVTLTSTAFEGGSQSGQVLFEKAVLGLAIEELIAEIDPSFIPSARNRLISPDFRFCSP